MLSLLCDLLSVYYYSPPFWQAEELIEELGLGLNSKKLKKVLAQLDPTGEGLVQRDDFLNWYSDKTHPKGK